MIRTIARLLSLCVATTCVLACQPPPQQGKAQGAAAGKAQGDTAGDDENDAPKSFKPVKLDLAIRVDPKTLGKVVDGGVPWDAEGNLVIEAPVLLEFGSPQKVRRFDWTFDRDDEWQVSFLLGKEVVGERHITVERNFGKPSGMWRSDYSVPASAREKGFDGVYIEASGGNKKYSIGHFQLIEDVNKFRKERRAERKRRKAEAKAAAEGGGAEKAGDDAETKGDAKAPADPKADATKAGDAAKAGEKADGKKADAKPAGGKKDGDEKAGGE